MSKKKIAAIIVILIAIIMEAFIFINVKPNADKASPQLVFKYKSNQKDSIQCYYSENEEFSEVASSKHEYNHNGQWNYVALDFDINSNYIRLDFGDIENVSEIKYASIILGDKTLDLSADFFLHPKKKNQIKSISVNNQDLVVHAMAGDSWIMLNTRDLNLKQTYIEGNQGRYLIYDILLSIVNIAVMVICLLNLDVIFRVGLEIYCDRQMFWGLTKNDFQARFAGSYLGVFWAFVQPFITILLYWFVFQVGLRAGNVSNYPFILFLMSGLIPWFYFSEALNGATNVLAEYSYLVKKVVFNVGILPVLKIASSIFVHLFFVAIIMIVCSVYGFTPDLYWLQLIYYILGMVLLVLGLSYITSACTAFFKDMTQIVNIVLTIGVWITPIMWNPAGVLSDTLIKVFQINPIYYIVDGFRDALLNKQWFWEKPIWTIYFWVVCILIYICGSKMFHRLKVHFSDVL